MESEHEAWLAEALAAHKAGDLEGAMAGYGRILEENPKHVDALNLLGLVALEAQRPDKAVEFFTDATELAPGIAPYRRNLADAHKALGQFAMAEASYHVAHGLDPEYLPALYNLAMLYLQVEDFPRAKQTLEEAQKLAPDDERVAHYLAALDGATLGHVAKGYAITEMDELADNFDKLLIEGLSYKAPTELAQMFTEHAPEAKDLLIVDVGCGTGLCGAAFAHLAKTLVGGDLAPRMIEKARERGVYDDLWVDDIIATLKRYSDVDLIIAADVFIYVGDLDDTFAACATALSPRGWFTFTVELGEKHFVIQPTGRFAHARSYLEELAAKYELEVRAMRECVLRTENDEPVAGLQVLLQRNA